MTQPQHGNVLQMTMELRRLVNRGAARWRRLVALEAISLVIAAPLLYLWMLFLIDNLLHLPTWARVLASLVFFAGFIGLAVVMVRRWRSHCATLTEDQVALAIERQAEGGLQNRLINSLQIARAGIRSVERRYFDALVAENFTALQSIALRPPRSATGAVGRAGLACLAVAAGLSFFYFQPDYFRNAATRILLPLADIDPIYRTRLRVEPGDVEVDRGSSVAIRIHVTGEAPEHVMLVTRTNGSKSRRQSLRIPLSPGQRAVTHVLENVTETTLYAVEGGDYRAPSRGGYFRVSVVAPPSLRSASAVIQEPQYTGRPPRTVRSVTGEFEALFGSRAQVTFHLDQEVEALQLKLTPASESASPAPVALTRTDDGGWTGSIEFRNIAGYELVADEPCGNYRVRVLPDQPPELNLSGLSRRGDADIDAIVPLTVQAKDDIGLAQVQLCVWRLDDQEPSEALEIPGTQPTIVAAWEPGHTTQLEVSHDLIMPALGAAEGDRLLVALRARDHDPAKANWTVGAPHVLRVVGEGSVLQMVYEQLLASEKSMRSLIDRYDAAQSAATAWMVKLDASSGLRWDDPKTVGELREAMQKQSKDLRALRELAAAAARDLAEPAASLRVSLALLADTELIRVVRIIDAVADRPGPMEMRQALIDARQVQQRVSQSVEQMLAEHVRIREEWELDHMIGFVKILAHRQGALAEGSGRRAQAQSEGTQKENAELEKLLRTSASRRQKKVAELTTLARRAMTGLASRLRDKQATLAAGFAVADKALADKALTDAMRQAVSYVEAGDWSNAQVSQADAADRLTAVYDALHAAQQQAAADALAALQQQGMSELEAQAELEKLRQGHTDQLKTGDPEAVPPTVLVRMGELAESKDHDLITKDAGIEGYKWDPKYEAGLHKGAPESVPFDVLKLADRPGGQRTFPESSDLAENPMGLALLQDPFEDLMGPLLEEADDLREQYETYNINAQGQGVEPGNVGKQAGDLNSMSAAAATGNMKPPTHDFGGASRVGMGGARSHGIAVGDEALDKRGRDQAQQGQERVPLQEGTMRQVQTDDPMKDMSTGFGGKRVDTKDPATFNTKDAGEWSDDIAQHMDDRPSDTHKIVERQGKPVDPAVAELLRDLEGTQEQVIERIKAIRKEFSRLYLPTEHLDRIAAELTSNLERLKQEPSPEVFRRQMRTIAELTSLALVYNQTGSDFQPSLPRRQSLKGRIFDEPAPPALPGYEAAVQRYYENLAR